MTYDPIKSSTRFEVRVTTDSYAGNFEREMFSFMTGVDDTGDYCPEIAEQACKEEGWNEYESPFEDVLGTIAGSDEQISNNYMTIDSDGTMQKPPQQEYLEMNVVVIAFSKQLTSVLFSILERRAKKFCEKESIGYKSIIMYKLTESGEEVQPL